MVAANGDTVVLSDLLEQLCQCYGPQHWWPASTPFEVMLGAVLVQNTRWRNADRALSALRRRGWLAPLRLDRAGQAQLAQVIRAAGCHNVKAGRVRALLDWFLDSGGYHVLVTMGTGELRASLLAVNGIGPETADVILLYALMKPEFVVDVYTRRLLQRLGMAAAAWRYEPLKLRLQSDLGGHCHRFGEYHAVIVEHGKQRCLRSNPLCQGCPLLPHCCYGLASTTASDPL